MPASMMDFSQERGIRLKKEREDDEGMRRRVEDCASPL